jgi:D-aspartate ligase
VLPRAILLEPNDGCLTIARRLAARGVDVVALCSPRTAWVSKSRYILPVLLDAPPGPADEQWLGAVTAVAGQPGVIISGSDAASAFVCSNRDRIPAALVSFEGPSTAHMQLMTKDGVYAVAREVGVRVPRTVRIQDRAQLGAVLRERPAMPCVVRPVLGHVARAAGGFETRLLSDLGALADHVGAALDLGIPMLLSEHVPGPPTALEGAITLRTASGELALEFGRRKIRDYDHGVGSLVEAIPAEEALSAARRIVTAADYVGLAATEFKRHSDTGELWLIEMNVRVPQYFGVYDAAGIDAAWRLYAALAGRLEGAQPRGRASVKVWMPQHDLHVVRQMRRSASLSTLQFMWSLRGVRDFGAFSWRDPRPGIEVLRIEARALCRRRSSRRSRRLQLGR